MEILSLTPVDLREVWPNEASDFTPWLAGNLDRLGEALNLDLELTQQEAPVGPFFVDILARDVNSKRNVVIENQLDATNHDHLGKALTYAAGYNADVIVWIVKAFRDEHRQVLDWLNQRTGETTEIYGVELRTVRIGDSAPAFIFDVVARPSSFQKSNAHKAELPSAQQSYRAFWPKVANRLRDDYRLTKSRGNSGNSFINFATEVRGVVYGAVYPSKAARTELYVNSGSHDWNKGLFDRLHSQKEVIEEQFGEPLEWERLDHVRASRIALYRHGRNIHDSEEILTDTANWMVENIVRFSQTVIPIVRTAAAEVDRELAPQYDTESDAEEDAAQ